MHKTPGFYIIIFFILLLFCSREVFSQQITAKRSKTIHITNDTTQIDSLTIIPSSVRVNNPQLARNSFRIDTLKGLFIVVNPVDFFLNKDTVKVDISYKVFPYNFNTQWQSPYKKDVLYKKQRTDDLPGSTIKGEVDDFFDFGDLQKSGAISRGFSLGNKQDASLNSDLNLQLNGSLTNDISIRAAITDNNIPIQPEGNTQQIQDFDKVFIEISQGKNKLTAGDFEIMETEDRFLRFRQKVQGLKVESTIPVGNKNKNRLSVKAGAALSKGKYSRNEIDGIEGNQGPYKLRGNNNERFVVILAGSETVYLNGQKLSRGEKQDYTINYNTAEITFTPENIISKDSRIIVEFEYSDRNYARAMFATSTQYKTKKLEVNLNYFNQSDLKNQPFEMDLNDTTRSVLASAGDDQQKMITGSVDSVSFSSEEILYKMIDSLGYDSVLVYSTNPDSAHYRVKFSRVGDGNGNYIKAKSAANGTVYKWKEPVGGKAQGSFAPVEMLVAPRKTEVISLSTSYNITNKTRTGFTTTLSNQDLNLFSTLDAKDNKGYAGELWINHHEKLNLNNDTNRIKWLSKGKISIIDRHFNPVNRFRSVEFDRDWNLNDIQQSNEVRTQISSELSKAETGHLRLSHQMLKREDKVTGQRYSAKLNLDKGGFFILGHGSLLNSDNYGIKSRFLRHKVTAGKRFQFFRLSLDEEREHNTFRLHGDSVNSNSYSFQTWGAEISLPDTSRFRTTVRYEQRRDKLPFNGSLKESSRADETSLMLHWNISDKQLLEARLSYRNLQILDSISNNKPEENITARINYSSTFAGGAITNQTFYESGSGLEVEKEFTYLEVSPGQGLYQWEDYNGNGVKEINEFEIASFRDQANYIRVYTPTDNYIQVFKNSFRQTLYVNPSRIWRENDSTYKKILSKFTNRFTYRVSQKNQFENYFSSYNPFFTPENNNQLITLNEQLKNTFYFQRSHSTFGMNWTHQRSGNKSLLANGSEQQYLKENELNVRWNMSSSVSILSEMRLASRKHLSEFFPNKEYNINIKEIIPTLSYQPSTKFRIKGLFTWTQKKNQNLNNEQARILKYGAELRHAALSKGDIKINFNYLVVDYSGSANKNLEYEMLKGFKNGNNYQWTLSYQRKLLAYLQLNLQYEGRKTPGATTVHIGRIQLRAYF
ncbi:MAG: hypothetical protein K9H84_03105 [Bacteroidales bacterium]|nr:hypothetical protein [Bacteroidales bacterium]